MAFITFHEVRAQKIRKEVGTSNALNTALFPLFLTEDLTQKKKCVIKILSLNYCFYKTSTYEDEEKKNQAKILVTDNLIDIIEPFVSVDNLLFKGL